MVYSVYGSPYLLKMIRIMLCDGISSQVSSPPIPRSSEILTKMKLIDRDSSSEIDLRTYNPPTPFTTPHFYWGSYLPPKSFGNSINTTQSPRPRCFIFVFFVTVTNTPSWSSSSRDLEWTGFSGSRSLERKEETGTGKE